MKKLTSVKDQSEEMLYDGICTDIANNTNFVKNQLLGLTTMQENLNKLEDQLAVLTSCGEILYSQNINGMKKKGNGEDEGMEMIKMDQNKNRKNEKAKKSAIDDDLFSMSLIESDLKVVAGVINDADVFKLNKLVFRVSHGKVATYTKPVGQIYTNYVSGKDPENMTVYMLVFQNSAELYQKVERLCDVFSKSKYDLEDAFSHEEREIKIKYIKNESE